MKKRNWVGLTDENSVGCHKFVGLTNVNESNDIRDEKVEQKDMNLKTRILVSTLFDLVSKDQGFVFEKKEHNDGFFKTSHWQDFRKHALLLTEFMKLDQGEVNKALSAFEKTLEKLGGVNGTGGVEQGLENLNKLDEILSKSGIKDVKPNIGVRHFLDILQDDNLKDGSVKTYDINKFVELILTRDSRKFGPILMGNRYTTLMSGLSKIFGKDDGIYDVIRKVIRQDTYTKNGAMCGKAELAMAMFFSDCKLPNDKGDIRLIVDGKDGDSLEIKGNGAVITDRETKNKELMKMKWGEIKGDANKVSNDDILDITIGEGTKVRDMDVKIKKNIEIIRDAIDEKYGDSLPRNVINAIKYKITFGALFKNYSTISYTSGKSESPKLNNGFNMMVIFNTDDDAGQLTKESKILNSPLIKIVPGLSDNWLDDGERILNQLDSLGINVSYQDAHGQGGFKAFFPGSKNG